MVRFIDAADRPPEHESRTLAMAGSDILSDLEARGLVHDSTDRAALAEALDGGPVSLYYGCDPTADSLHAGNLVGLLVLRRFQLAGHRPIALAGGATGMVGDPSGRSDERNLLDEATLARNVAAISSQLERFVDFDDPDVPALLVDNSDWTTPLTVVEFLRDVGKHVTVNQMIAKESVRARLNSGSGISFTEFSYMLLQANDFAHLFVAHDCVLQIGGSDQWGNITAGIDLIRRRHGGRAHGLTWPLITRADGTKFGKSKGENIWLAPERTSPYRFYQYWVNTDDRDVERFLLQLTLLPLDEVRAVVAEHQTAPERRVGQRRLAAEVTRLVHGPEALVAAIEASDLLFARDAPRPSIGALESLLEEIPTAELPRSAGDDPIDPVDVLTAVGLASSKGDARRSIAGGAVSVGGVRLADSTPLDPSTVWYGRYLLVRKGKQHGLVVLS